MFAVMPRIRRPDNAKQGRLFMAQSMTTILFLILIAAWIVAAWLFMK
jgi:hypothetical protein